MINISKHLPGSGRIIPYDDQTNQVVEKKKEHHPLLMSVKRIFCCFNSSNKIKNFDYPTNQVRQSSVSTFHFNYERRLFLADPNLVGQLNGVLKSIESGILPEILSMVIDASIQDNVVIGFRPVSKFASTWAKMGFPSKPFILKDKSSKYGVNAGLVCSDKYLEKTSTYIHNPTKIQTYPYNFKEDRIKEVLANPEFFNIDKQSIAVINQTTNLDELIRKEKIIYQINQKFTPKSKKTYQILEKNQLNNCWKLYEAVVDDEQSLETKGLDQIKKPVLFWGYVENNESFSEPFTADYDLLSAGFDVNNIKEDKLKRPVDITQENFNLENEHITKGNVYPALESLIRNINVSIKKINNNLRSQVHHNDEAGNPFATTEEAALFPAVFTFPEFDEQLQKRINDSLSEKIGKRIENNIMICSSFKDFAALVDTFENKAPQYKLGVNPRWREAIKTAKIIGNF